MKKQIPNTTVRKISNVSGGLEWEGSKDAPYLRGTVSTPYGIVRVYAQECRLPFYDLSIIVDGYEYTRADRRCPARKTLVTMAGKFAREVVEGEA